MKSFKLFSTMLFALLILSMSLVAQTIQLKTTTGALFTYGTQATLSTTDASYHTIATLPLATNTAGIIEVTVTGVNTTNGDGITGAAIARFSKASGTLTVGDTTNILATEVDTGLSGGTWDISTSSDNIIVRVKGKASTTVRWRCLIKQLQ
jgi:hypothetical protein